MSTTTRSATALATGLMVAMLAVGCTGGTDAPTEAAPDPLATVDTIVVGAAGLSLRSGDAEIAMLPFAGGDLDEQAATLETVFGAEGEPAGIESDENCVAPQTRWSWGETYHGTRALHTDEGSLVFLTFDDAVTRPDGSEVRIETTNGLAVGDIDDAFRPLPDLQKDESFAEETGYGYYLYDVLRVGEGSLEPTVYGALAVTVEGVVDHLASPTTLQDYC
jgi:hypothetical protein